MSSIRKNDYLEFCINQRGLSENSVRAYAQDLAAFQRFLATRDCGHELSAETILSFNSFLRAKQKVSPATLRRRLTTLRAYFEWLATQPDGAPSPFNGLKLELRIPPRLPRPVDRPTLSRLFRASRRIADGDAAASTKRNQTVPNADQVTGLVLRLLVVTGLRIGEITGLRLADVSSNGAAIRVVGKGNRERVVYISNTRLLADFRAYLDWRALASRPADHVFLNNRGNRLSEAAFRKRLRSLSQDQNIEPHITPHMLRHSAATLLIEEGVDIRLVQRLLGHASVLTTEIYTKVSDNSLINAMERADTLGKVDS